MNFHMFCWLTLIQSRYFSIIAHCVPSSCLFVWLFIDLQFDCIVFMYVYKSNIFSDICIASHWFLLILMYSVCHWFSWFFIHVHAVCPRLAPAFVFAVILASSCLAWWREASSWPHPGRWVSTKSRSRVFPSSGLHASCHPGLVGWLILLLTHRPARPCFSNLLACPGFRPSNC